MDRNNDIENKIKNALELPERMQRQEPDNYFYTRLQARMERERQAERRLGWKPRLALVLTALLLLANAWVLWNGGRPIPADQEQNFAKEYQLSGSNDYYGLNMR